MLVLPRLSMAKAALSPSTKGGKCRRVLAARLLDFDDFGTGFGKHQGCERAWQKRGEIHDKKAGQRLHGSLDLLAVGKTGEDEPKIRQREIENVDH